jgi:hypothetical protein
MQAFLLFLSRLSKRERLIFYAAAGVVSLLLLDRLMLKPIISQAASLNIKINHKKVSIKEALLIISQKERLDKESNIYMPYLEKALSDEDEKHALLKYIGNLADSSPVSVTYIKMSGIKEETLLKKYHLRLICVAQMEQIVNFFYNIENSKKLIKIEKWHIKTEAGVTKCTMDISKAVIY